MRNIRLLICYDGSRYRGWQRLPGKDDTIQAKIENVLSRILGETIEISGSGRTDAGVHAQGQVANFHCENTMPCPEMLRQLPASPRLPTGKSGLPFFPCIWIGFHEYF